MICYSGNVAVKFKENSTNLELVIISMDFGRRGTIW